jgi:hypothetical protein
MAEEERELKRQGRVVVCRGGLGAPEFLAM